MGRSLHSKAHPAPPLAARGRTSALYRPRRPEQTVLYQAVAGNLRTLQALAELEGKSLPGYVAEEFETFLRCGVLAYGFLRLGCADCGYEQLLAFSCKKRGFCTSCGGRRMVESAAHLVEEVFPRAGVRQWVLSFPMPVRFILAKNPALQARCLTIVHRAISAHLRKRARTQGLRLRLEPGAVTLIQRFGGSLNLNVHFHMLFLEGGYFLTRRGPRLWKTGPPTDEDVQALVATIVERVIRMLRKKGYFSGDVAWAAPESDTQGESLLPDLQAASVQSRIALGEHKGGYVRRLGMRQISTLTPQLQGPLCAEISGFSLHAALYCAPKQRKKLEMVCRYITRPAVAEERLDMLPSGDIRLKLKHPYTDGTTHLVFSGLEFVEKLAALVPQPRIHLTRFFGCLAPHAKIRSQIVPQKPVLTPMTAPDQQPPEPEPAPRSPWAELLARVFGFDLKTCPQCGGNVKIIAAILEPFAITSILSYLGLPDKPPPPPAPAQVGSQATFA